MKVLKKVGWFIVSLLPAGLCVGLQYAAAYGVLYYYYFQVKAERQGMNDPYLFLLQLASIRYMAKPLYAVLLYQAAALLVYGLWYYFAFGKKKRPMGTEKCGLKKLPVVIILGIFIQILISAALNIIYLVKPSLLRNYIKLMQAAGIGEMTVLAFVTTVILAPIGEELLCRGIILKFAEKVSKKFWLANCIQALAFGIIHMNWVQGIYAFMIGIVLGYLYGKYRNIWVCMLLHAVINCSSNFVGYLWTPFSEEYELYANIGFFVLSLLILTACFKILGRIREPEVVEMKITENRVTYDDI